jgi:AraC-like DNA-binding protein/CheY-like chemotaxis protein
MPDMAGEDVLRRLSAAQSRPPVIVMSAVREVETVVECMKLGATDYVTKPWECGEFGAAIQRSLRGAAAEPGVLLVSDDPVALAPMQLALHSHVRVGIMSVAAATESRFPALIVVLHAPDPSYVAAVSGLRARFPSAEVFLVSDDPELTRELHAMPNRLDLLVRRVNRTLGDREHVRDQLPRAVVAAVEVMASHCAEPLTLAEIASRVGISEDHLGRLFRQTFGVTAASYYVRLRIAVACRLLRDTDQKMDDVAHRVGYSGAAKLSRAFKEVMGIRPGEFRRTPR